MMRIRNIVLLIIFCTITPAAPQAKQVAVITTGNRTAKNEDNKETILYGIASYYADKFVGRQTANGQYYSHDKMTAACNKLPLNTWIRVTNLRNKKSVIVFINDRLHPLNKRLVDLSRMAAQKLGYIGHGLAQVKVEVVIKKGSN
jgi:rare lipoprotein A